MMWQCTGRVCFLKKVTLGVRHSDMGLAMVHHAPCTMHHALARMVQLMTAAVMTALHWAAGLGAMARHRRSDILQCMLAFLCGHVDLAPCVRGSRRPLRSRQLLHFSK